MLTAVRVPSIRRGQRGVLDLVLEILLGGQSALETLFFAL